MNCPNRVKIGQDTDFQSLLIAQLFLQPAVYIGYWIDGTQAGRRLCGDRRRIVLREKVTENAPLATLFEEEAQEKPEVDCVLQHEPARRNKNNFTY